MICTPRRRGAIRRGHVILCSAIVFTLPASRTGRAGEVESAPTVQQIFDVWNARCQQIRSARFTFTDETVLMRGSRNGRRGRRRDDQGRAFPDAPLTLLRENEVVFDGDKVRRDRRGPDWVDGAECAQFVHYVELYDGERCLSYYGFDGKSDDVHPLQFVYPARGDRAGVFPGRLPSLWPVFHALRIQHPGFERFDAKTYRLLDREGTIDGRRCLILAEDVPPAGSTLTHYVWVDPEKNYSVVRTQSGARGTTLFQLDIDYTHDDASGLWVPSHWVHLYHAEVVGGGRVLQETATFTVTDYALNPPVDDATFTFEPPSGTSIQSYTSGEREMSLMRDSGPRAVTQDELQRGARYIDLLNTPSGEALRPPGIHRWRWTWLALALAFAGFAWLFWRRR